MTNKNTQKFYLNEEKYVTIEFPEGDQTSWKIVPLSNKVIGSGFHTGTASSWTNQDHFDYIDPKRMDTGYNSYIVIEKTGQVCVGGSMESAFLKDPSAKIILMPIPTEFTKNFEPKIEVSEIGSLLKIKSDIPVFLKWASTKGNLTTLI